VTVKYRQGKDPGSVVVELKKLAGAVATAGGATLSVTSDLPYAYGIETGYHRSGGLARARGGAWMFRNGVNRGLRGIEQEVASALGEGEQAVVRAYLAKGRRVVSEVQQGTPVRTGALRRSVRMRFEVDGEPVRPGGTV
jgi:hypothetical protein